jgi:hypothetical protein
VHNVNICTLKVFAFKNVIIHKFSDIITIKHVSTFVNKVENPYKHISIFDLIDKCRYVFYDYDGRHFVTPFKNKNSHLWTTPYEEGS